MCYELVKGFIDYRIIIKISHTKWELLHYVYVKNRTQDKHKEQLKYE